MASISNRELKLMNMFVVVTWSSMRHLKQRIETASPRGPGPLRGHIGISNRELKRNIERLVSGLRASAKHLKQRIETNFAGYKDGHMPNWASQTEN